MRADASAQERGQRQGEMEQGRVRSTALATARNSADRWAGVPARPQRMSPGRLCRETALWNSLAEGKERGFIS